MNLRLGAAVILATLIPLTATIATSPARAGVDTTPPAVGSCHELTWDNADDLADPDPAVPCTDRHTSVTTKVVTFANTPDWTDEDVILAIARRQCTPANLAFFSDNARAYQLSTYSSWFFIPTKAQRDAGASWMRCDVTLYGYYSLKPLPTDGDPELGPLPLDDKIARCRKGKRSAYNVSSCDKPHQFHATHGVKYPSDGYPGDRRLQRWTHRKCDDKLGRSFGYYEWPSRSLWKLGLVYSVCYKTTTS